MTLHTCYRQMKLIVEAGTHEGLSIDEGVYQKSETLEIARRKKRGGKSKVDDPCGMPMSVRTLEEIIEDNRAKCLPQLAPSILSFVDEDQLELDYSVIKS